MRGGNTQRDPSTGQFIGEKPKLVTCDTCGKEFRKCAAEIRNTEHDFCCRECYHEWDNKKVVKVCDFCGEKFEERPSEKHRFCSRECYLGWISRNSGKKHPRYNRVTRECEYCGKEFEVVNSRGDTARFCSQECYGQWRSENIYGKNHPEWNGGDDFRYNKGWHKQRKKRFEYDRYICQECGKPKEEVSRLVVHHIKPVRQFNNQEKAHKLSNLITLCQSCHMEIENERRKKRAN